MEGQQAYSQRIINVPLKKVEVHKIIPCDIKEDNEKKIHFIEQFVSEVLDFSSQYGSDTSISYTAYNLTGKPSKFPDYGDFPQAFVMKTYGNWWREAPSRSIEYMPQNTPRIPSHDYVDLSFEVSVYPFRVSIYETYNPGAVVRIWALNQTNSERRWYLLWEGEARVVEHVPRIFSPVIQTVGFITNVLRLEFNHSHLDYHTGLDAVLLVGTKQPIRVLNANTITQQVVALNLHNIPAQNSDLQSAVAEFQQKENLEVINGGVDYNGSFQCLPDETILKILGYLDLKTLLRVSQLNKHLNALSNDGFLYSHLSLRPYWSRVTEQSLQSLAWRCTRLQKLDLSWCGHYNAIQPEHFKRFVQSCCSHLTHIRLNCCKFVNNSTMQALSDCCHGLQEVGLRNCVAITEVGFLHLTSLNSLEILDLYRTTISDSSLIAILKVNPNLKHLNIGACVRISNMDDVACALSTHNPLLQSVDLWKTCNLSQQGVAALSKCRLLEEVDFGWCLGLSLPVDSLSALSHNCPRLRKLFLTALRGIGDRDLESFVDRCKLLEQIDLLGVRGVTNDMCLRIITELPRLRLLDLSFCDQISDCDVSRWRQLAPHVAIKRSFQTDLTAASGILYQQIH